MKRFGLSAPFEAHAHQRGLISPSFPFWVHLPPWPHCCSSSIQHSWYLGSHNRRGDFSWRNLTSQGPLNHALICCAWDSPDLWPGGPVHSFLPCVHRDSTGNSRNTHVLPFFPLSAEGVILTCLLRGRWVQHRSVRLLTSTQVEINPLWIKGYIIGA